MARILCPPSSLTYRVVPSLLAAMPQGCEKVLKGPVPSPPPTLPLPATVLTTPPTRRRTRWFCWSVMYTPPAGVVEDTAAEAGVLKAAVARAGPSANAGVPTPATVPTAPLASTTLLTLCPDPSQKYSKVPVGSRAPAVGLLSTAAAPLPSLHPAAPLPASVPTAPPLRTLTLLEPESITSTAPVGVVTRPLGVKKVAPPSAAPSALPAAPLPAAVLT